MALLLWFVQCTVQTPILLGQKLFSQEMLQRNRVVHENPQSLRHLFVGDLVVKEVSPEPDFVVQVDALGRDGSEAAVQRC